MRREAESMARSQRSEMPAECDLLALLLARADRLQNAAAPAKPASPRIARPAAARG
jgi:hypothetical protein